MIYIDIVYLYENLCKSLERASPRVPESQSDTRIHAGPSSTFPYTSHNAVASRETLGQPARKTYRVGCGDVEGSATSHNARTWL